MGRTAKRFFNLKPFQGQKRVKAAAREKAAEEGDCDQRIGELRDRAATERAGALKKAERDSDWDAGGGWNDDEGVCCDCEEAGLFCTCARHEDRDEGALFPELRCEPPGSFFQRRCGGLTCTPCDGAWKQWMGSSAAEWLHTRAPATWAEGLHCQQLGLDQWRMLDFDAEWRSQRAKVLRQLRREQATARAKGCADALIAREQTTAGKLETAAAWQKFWGGERPGPNAGRKWDSHKKCFVGGVKRGPGRPKGASAKTTVNPKSLTKKTKDHGQTKRSRGEKHGKRGGVHGEVAGGGRRARTGGRGPFGVSAAPVGRAGSGKGRNRKERGPRGSAG